MVKNKPKWSPFLHGISAFSGVAGIFALIFSWISSIAGTFMGMTEEHWFNDSVGLLLVSITFGVGTLIHLSEEKRK